MNLRHHVMSGLPARFTDTGFRLAAVAMLLAVTVFFFAPRLALWNLDYSGAFEAARGLTFLAQCEDPFRTDVELAMRWRVLPPLVCHALGLKGWMAFAIPWAGVAALVWAGLDWFLRHGLDRRAALAGGLLVATSSGVLVPLGWLGINDGWTWLCLLSVTAARSNKGVAVALLLGPWIDERVVVGLPLALWSRHCLDPKTATPGRTMLLGLWVAPYLVSRLAAVTLGADQGTGRFLSLAFADCAVWLPYAPLGWWMALRAGWLPVVFAAADWWQHGKSAFALGAVSFVAVAVPTLVLAADLSRSAAIFLPVLFLGWVRLAPRLGDRQLLAVSMVQLLLPAAHVVYNKIAVISPLLLELYRLWRLALV
ncbi:MAG: hypothetical protein C0502_00370 [Opitutus sp.]|nr:hypothetical protein [Opitutus sp.]